MGITKNNTHWLFMLTSSTKPEDRHLNDVIFGVKILLKKSIPIENISLMIDDDKSTIVQKMAPLITDTTALYTYSDMPALLQRIDKKNLVIIVTGHGSIEGIDSNPSIRPYVFLHTIQQNTKAEKVFLLLGQCYAGIFNLLQVTKGQRRGGIHTPHIIIIGATRIATSISLPSEYDDISWDANIMLAAFFRWIDDPVDIDGDNRYSFIDAFKYITYVTNTQCYKLEKLQYIQTIRLTEQYKELYKQLQETPKETLPLDDLLTLQALEQSLEREFIHQEAWILNVPPARSTDVTL